MKMARKAKGNGLEALRLIEKMYASSEVDRAEDLRSEMKDLDPVNFVCFGEYMESVLQTQSKLEVIGKPEEESMNGESVCKGQSTSRIGGLHSNNFKGR